MGIKSLLRSCTGSSSRLNRSAKKIYTTWRLVRDRMGIGIAIGRHTSVARRASVRIVDGGTIRIGQYCTIHDYAMILTYNGKIEIGDHTTINPFCVLYGIGGLRIGSGVRIATQAVIVPGNHQFDDSDTPIYKQGIISKGIVVEDDVWIGAGARILDGITIGRGAVVGAGAVVTKDVPSYAVVAGVPARVIKYRRTDKGDSV